MYFCYISFCLFVRDHREPGPYGHAQAMSCSNIAQVLCTQARNTWWQLSAAMAIDSAATFDERVIEIGLGDQLAHFHSVGWVTYAKLANDTGYVPGASLDLLHEEIFLKGLGENYAKHPLKGTLRRLFFEAYTLSAADLKRKLEAGPDDAPRVVPTAEKLARRKRCAAKLPCIALKDELDISDTLLERAMEMYDNNSVTYLPLEACTKKESALLGVRKDKRWEQVPNAYGKIELRRTDDDRTSDVDSQFAFMFAYQRRNLALDMANVLDFNLSEKLRSKLMAVYMKPPPTNFLPVDMNQILEADFVFWSQMNEETTNGIKQKATGRPCDLVFDVVFNCPEFRCALMNRQAGGGRTQAFQPRIQQMAPLHAPVNGQPGKKSKGQKKRESRQRLEDTQQQAPPPARQKPPFVTERPMKIAKTALPKQLIGMCSKPAARTNATAFCFAYNLSGCNDAPAGKACKRGFHGCMKPLPNGEACSGPHPVSGCTM